MRNKQKRINLNIMVISMMVKVDLHQIWGKSKIDQMKPIQNFPNLLVLEKKLTVWAQRSSTQIMRS